MTLLPVGALAHTSLIDRSDLPLPELLFIYGALLIVIASFVELILGWHRTRFEDVPSRPLSKRASRLVLNPLSDVACGLIGIALLVLMVWTGLTGTEAPNRNFSVTFISVTAGLGFVVLPVLLGDVFRAFNPWRVRGRAVERQGGDHLAVLRHVRQPLATRGPGWEVEAAKAFAAAQGETTMRWASSAPMPCSRPSTLTLSCPPKGPRVST